MSDVDLYNDVAWIQRQAGDGFSWLLCTHGFFKAPSELEGLFTHDISHMTKMTCYKNIGLRGLVFQINDFLRVYTVVPFLPLEFVPTLS